MLRSKVFVVREYAEKLTNCYKGKNPELQHTGYKKKLHQEKKEY